MRRFLPRLVAVTRRMASSFAEHKIDEANPHWMDFYSRYEANIDMVAVHSTRPDRKLAILEIPNENLDAPYAFFIHGSCARMGLFHSIQCPYHFPSQTVTDYNCFISFLRPIRIID